MALNLANPIGSNVSNYILLRVIKEKGSSALFITWLKLRFLRIWNSFSLLIDSHTRASRWKNFWNSFYFSRRSVGENFPFVILWYLVSLLLGFERYRKGWSHESRGIYTHTYRRYSLEQTNRRACIYFSMSEFFEIIKE